MDRTVKTIHKLDDLNRDDAVNDQMYADLPAKRLIYFYSLVKFKGFNYRLALVAAKNKTYDELNELVKLDIDKYVSIILSLMDKHLFKEITVSDMDEFVNGVLADGKKIKPDDAATFCMNVKNYLMEHNGYEDDVEKYFIDMYDLLKEFHDKLVVENVKEYISDEKNLLRNLPFELIGLNALKNLYFFVSPIINKFYLPSAGYIKENGEVALSSYLKDFYIEKVKEFIIGNKLNIYGNLDKYLKNIEINYSIIDPRNAPRGETAIFKKRIDVLKENIDLLKVQLFASNDEDFEKTYGTSGLFAEYNDSSDNLGESFYKLGEKYEKGTDGITDIESAFLEYELSSKEGYEKAYYKVGEFLYNGKGVKQDYSEAFKYLTKAAALKDDRSYALLGDAYYFGKGTNKNEKEAIKWYKKGVDTSSYAKARLGYAYLYSLEEEDNLAKAYKWISQSAKENDAKGLEYLASLYQFGKYVKKDINKAVDLYISSGKQNNSYAYFLLGKMYITGQDTEANPKEALKWFLKGRDYKEPYCLCVLGSAYLDGEKSPFGKLIKQDKEKGIVYLKNSVEQGIEEAQYLLATCYFNGFGVDMDFDKALKLYKESAEKGYVESQLALGNYYSDLSFANEENRKKAFEWYKEAAEQNNGEALYKLGRCYQRGIGVERNSVEAFKAYKKSAEENNLDGLCSLGECYRYQIGVERDYEKALELFETARKKGSTRGAELEKKLKDWIASENRSKQTMARLKAEIAQREKEEAEAKAREQAKRKKLEAEAKAREEAALKKAEEEKKAKKQKIYVIFSELIGAAMDSYVIMCGCYECYNGYTGFTYDASRASQILEEAMRRHLGSRLSAHYEKYEQIKEAIRNGVEPNWRSADFVNVWEDVKEAYDNVLKEVKKCRSKLNKLMDQIEKNYKIQCNYLASCVIRKINKKYSLTETVRKKLNAYINDAFVNNYDRCVVERKIDEIAGVRLSQDPEIEKEIGYQMYRMFKKADVEKLVNYGRNLKNLDSFEMSSEYYEYKNYSFDMVKEIVDTFLNTYGFTQEEKKHILDMAIENYNAYQLPLEHFIERFGIKI